MKKWALFIKEFSNLLFFWCFGIFFFFLYRLGFILFFHKKIVVLEAQDLLRVFFMGFRFDATVMGYFTILLLVLSFIFIPLGKASIVATVRKFCSWIFIILSPLICLITINYFIEYDNQFNHFLFLGLYDDQKAVMQTILQDFHPFLNLFLWIFICVVSWFILRFFEPKQRISKALLAFTQTKVRQVVFILVLLTLFVGGIRGSFAEFPAKRFIAGVSKDRFLNKTIINPYRSLEYAYDDYKMVNQSKENPYRSDEELAKLYPLSTIDEYLKKEKTTEPLIRPKQIFLVIMESYDSWPLMEKYRPLKLSTQLSKIADNGLRYSHFLPASYNTFNSFGAITTGIPFVGNNISHVREKVAPFATSIFKQFNDLGYATNTFYGGYLSWENIGEFSLFQGCENVYSAMDKNQDTSLNVWGVEDEDLFKIVMNKVSSDRPSFNVILTTSYHPPYVIDIYKKGFPYKTKEDMPKEMQQYYEQGMSIEEMGHLWYSDKCIGDFVREAQKKYPDAIFCFTGDHYGRRFLTHQPSLYEESSVNFIVYGKGIAPKHDLTPGTHIDILPTLIDLVAPKGFEYYSFGKSLLDSDKKEAIALDKMIAQDSLMVFSNQQNLLMNLNTMQPQNAEPSRKYKKKYTDFMGLGWWYLTHK